MSEAEVSKQSKLQHILLRLAALERQLIAAGALAAVLLTLYSQSIHARAQKGTLLEELSIHEDLHNLYYAAASANWKQSFSWWVGPWNYPGAGYYRPLTSVLFLAEYQVFGDDFASYNRVTYILHTLNAALLFLLVVSLLRGRGPIRVLCGLIAAYFFATPASVMEFATARALDWWPAQNDPLSLVFGLLSLLLLDRHLAHPSKTTLAATLVAFYLSVASKEMGFIIAPMAVVLIGWRKGKFTRESAWFMGLAVFLYFFRLAVVPNPWKPAFHGLWTVTKALNLWFGDHSLRLQTGDYWFVLSALAITAFLLFGLKRRWSIYSIGVCAILSVALFTHAFGVNGGFAIIANTTVFSVLTRMVGFQLCLVLFLRYFKQDPGPFAALAFALSFIPILGYSGTYYYYWPAALLGLADGVFAACLARWLNEIWPNINWSCPAPVVKTWNAAFAWTKEKETLPAETKR